MSIWSSKSALIQRRTDRFKMQEWAAATAGDDDYKAVVFVFLSGGVDTFNVLAPKDDDLYAHYAEIRGVQVRLPLQ